MLVPMIHGCRQMVLLGDHRQLRPTVVSDAAAEGGLRFSLFERLIKCGVPTLPIPNPNPNPNPNPDPDQVRRAHFPYPYPYP